MAAPEMDALKAQWAITKPIMLKAMSVIDTQAINPAEVAAITTEMKTLTDGLDGKVTEHSVPTPTPSPVPAVVPVAPPAS